MSSGEGALGCLGFSNKLNASVYHQIQEKAAVIWKSYRQGAENLHKAHYIAYFGKTLLLEGHQSSLLTVVLKIFTKSVALHYAALYSHQKGHRGIATLFLTGFN